MCSWARHSTLTVPLSTQEYKWVPANCWGNLTNCREVTCDGLASHFMLQKPGEALAAMSQFLAPRLNFTTTYSYQMNFMILLRYGTLEKEYIKFYISFSSTLGFFKSQVYVVYIPFKAIYALKFVIKEMSGNFCFIISRW